MRSQAAAFRIVVKLIGLTVLGLVGVILGAVALSLASVVATLAVIGFCIWLPLHLVFRGDRIRMKFWTAKVRDGCQNIAEDVAIAQQATSSWLQRAWQRFGQMLKSAGAFMIEVISGGVVGFLLFFLTQTEHRGGEEMVVAGTLIGAGIGLVVALVQRQQRMHVRLDS